MDAAPFCAKPKGKGTNWSVEIISDTQIDFSTTYMYMFVLIFFPFLLFLYNPLKISNLLKKKKLKKQWVF